jgi:putative lipoic acid-binding regulatory protein
MSEEETLLEFPCQFSIKAMGINKPNFDSIVVDVILQHVNEIKEGAVVTRLSKKGKYLSVTVMIDASSKRQLDAIYQGLTDCPDVVMAL